MLEKEPKLEASIRLRLPYIEPLNHLQIELLKRHRDGEADQRIREGIQLSINAIATRYLWTVTQFVDSKAELIGSEATLAVDC